MFLQDKNSSIGFQGFLKINLLFLKNISNYMSLCYWTGNEISSVNQESKIAGQSEAGVITWHEGEVMLNMVISVNFKSWTLHVHVPVYNH